MKYTFIGLVSSALFGVFFGSEGRMDPEIFNLIFWGLIGTGAGLHAIQILRDELCGSCDCRVCQILSH